MTFRYFVIGSGSIGRRHADNLASLAGANVTLHSWRSVDLGRLLSDIAACKTKAGVVIATAANIRLPLITECARQRLLYIEKPIAYRTSDINQILNLPQRTLERSVAGFMMRYHPMVQKILSTQP